jgi:hypothetical protein
MKRASWLCMLGAYVAAVAFATLWGSVFQTQHTLHRLAALGVDISAGTRLSATLRDLAGFAPVYAVIVAATLLVVFLIAGLLSRLTPQVHHTLHALGAGAGLAVAIRLIDALAPMPTLISSTRSLTGLLVIALGALIAGGLYAWITRPRFAVGDTPGR